MTTYNFAHRGARSLAPENTLIAVKKAWEIGCDGIEVDVQVSADGHLVIHHDQTLMRTTNISDYFPTLADQPITTFPLEDLRILDAGSWFVDRDPFSQIKEGHVSFEEMEQMYSARIPTLEEILHFIKDKSWRINLELKKVVEPLAHFPVVEEVLKQIGHVAINPGQIILSSFHHPYLDTARRLNPDIEIQALIGGSSSGTNEWGDYQYPTYNADHGYIDRDQIIRAHEQGCTVNLYTVNDPEKMKRYIDWGVSTLITDFPQLLKKLIQDLD